MRGRIHFCKGLVPLLFSSLLMVLCLAGCAQDSNILDNRKSRQLKFSVTTHGWNNSNSSSSGPKLDSRATPITGSTFDTSNSFNIIADVNKESDWFAEVNNETASYSTANNIWQTSATHYWPGTDSMIDFYAYYPTSISNKVTHATGSAPVLSYIVPDNVTDQIDILASTKTDVAGDSYSQTPVDFKHIFAAVQFCVGGNGMPSGTITGVTLNNIQYKGTYILDGTWVQNTTDKKSFSQALSVSTSAGTAITSGTTTFMMMPQTLSSNASITVTYSNGGTLTKTITGTWEAGQIYTYNLSKTITTANFDYTGEIQSYTVPLTGIYKLEVWGAQGGGLNQTETSSCAGYGGYAYGNIKVNKGQTLYVCVGGSGTLTTVLDGLSGGGYNGGGNGHKNSAGNAGYGGGGATHIATVSGVLSSLVSNTSSVIIVAGGGGGADDPGGDDGSGGNGGGNIGGNAKNGGVEVSGTGGTQTSGYSFGQGGPSMNSGADQGGGGGGWYGGYGASVINQMGGGGGSGHICSNLISGTTGMTNGVRTGNGYARITFVSAN